MSDVAENLFTDLAEAVLLRGVGPRIAMGVDLDSVERLGRLIRRRRHELGLSQAGLASRAGVGRRLVVEIERGKPAARAAELLRVITAAGLVLNARADRTQTGSPGH